MVDWVRVVRTWSIFLWELMRTLDGYHFAHPLRVRFAEVDAQQVVFNAHYLTYLDIAFAAYLKRGVQVWQEGLPRTVIARTTLEFKNSARYDDDLLVSVRTAHIGRTSLRVEFAVLRVVGESEELLATAETTYVYIHQDSKRPAPVPDDWRETILRYEGRTSLDPSAAEKREGDR
ncbi:thioesterase family protein [Alicyclobacillus sp. SP_1]|jgi:acyl-CoA thioester hydrolase|uniref:acyl-CoA thioesterase n=1 Tax=Alicyclobacillus sp. SP_1 TaxID=2942475 RepID=UPI00215874F7|nr:thioesterase family protein [Alicyclobacillus sp. SP_1]